MLAERARWGTHPQHVGVHSHWKGGKEGKTLVERTQPDLVLLPALVDARDLGKENSN